MQAEDSPRAVPSERSGLKPTTAFLLLLSGAALVAAIVYLTRPTPAPTPTGTPVKTAPNFALTNEEAIARFEELNGLLSQAYVDRDVSLFSSFLAEGSPLIDTGGEEIRRLLKDKVTPVPRIAFSTIQVRSNEADEVVIRAIEIDRSYFVSEGQPLDRDDPIKRTVDWTLRLEDSRWLLFDSAVVRSRVLRN